MLMIMKIIWNDYELSQQSKVCSRFKPCRDPGHWRLFIICISIGRVLVGSWSRAGELHPQRLSKEDGERPNSEPRLRSPGCLLWAFLSGLSRGVVGASGQHNRQKEIPQQCDNGGRRSPHRRNVFRHHRMDLSGRVCSPAGAIRTPEWTTPLYDPTKCQYHSGDWRLSGGKLCDSIPSSWRNWDPSHTIGTTTTRSRMWSLPGRRRPTSEKAFLQLQYLGL